MPKILMNINSQKSIEDTIKRLKEYRDSIDGKIKLFLERLADEGIAVAKENVDDQFAPHVRFEKTEVTKDGEEHKIIMRGVDLGTLIATWYHLDGTSETAQVNALLMAEVGSGNWANNNAFNIDGAGQGTFPGQTHAFQEEWYWRDADGEKHYTSGTMPTYPMVWARNTMKQNIEKIGKEVFGNGK